MFFRNIACFYKNIEPFGKSFSACTAQTSPKTSVLGITNANVIELVLNILPVILFLIFLFLLDSFKLVQKNYPAGAILWGMLSAAIAYQVHSVILGTTEISSLLDEQR